MSELALKLIKEAKEKRLTRLDLGNCGLTELPDALFELTWLEELVIGDIQINKKNERNDIQSFNTEIKRLKDLKILFANNQHFLIGALLWMDFKKNQ